MDVAIPESAQEHSISNSMVDGLSNSSNSGLTPDMIFNDGHVVSITVYSILMVIGATGNLTVLFLLRRRGAPRTRINIMLVHLAIADLLVIFLMMPLEIAWAATVYWKAGDIACRIMAFLRTFGLYLSSFVLICISVDRYFAVLKPLQSTSGEKRSRLMLAFAWMASVICSSPQVIVFHLQPHPNVTWYTQCVTYGSFDQNYKELLYNMYNLVMMYTLPLAVFIFCYTSILIEIIRRSRDSLDHKMRRSSLGFLGRAKTRTLKMTITIVAVFFICWTPYYIMSLWYWIDRKSAEKVDQRVQRGLFLFASANSCMNPLVYGMYNVRARTQVRWPAPPPPAPPDRDADSRLGTLSESLVQLTSFRKPGPVQPVRSVTFSYSNGCSDPVSR